MKINTNLNTRLAAQDATSSTVISISPIHILAKEGERKAKRLSERSREMEEQSQEEDQKG